MYLSRLIVSNFRSIKFLDIKFAKGKNVIVGRNNSGKSNIVRALDIVLGEKSPAYDNYENITQTDFYSNHKYEEQATSPEYADKMYIFCELSRSPDEPLDFSLINRSNGFYKLVKQKGRGRDQNDEEQLVEKMDENPGGFNYFAGDVFDYRVDDLDWTRKRWVDSKLDNQVRFETELSDKYSFGFLFKATCDGDKIYKDMRFLYRNDRASSWNLAFKCSLRNELLLSAIIPSFRDPSQQLRLTSWSWYGKLVRRLTEGSAEEEGLVKAFASVKEAADRLFLGAKTKIQNSALDVAFPGAELHFQFAQDVKTDIYKNFSLYVDDGVKSLLTDKGSGIQSATIIGLFSYYVKELCTNTSALLCVEEPELYLHPHARRVISKRLDAFSGENNQVVITTHSSEFLNSSHSGLNVIQVERDRDSGTTAKNLNLNDRKSIMLDSRYNEIFFAEKVIVCEGFDSYVLEWVARNCISHDLDEMNVSIIPVGGKDNLIKVAGMIQKRLNIQVYIVSDFDFLLRDKTIDSDKYGVPKHDSIDGLGSRYFSQNYIAGEEGAEIYHEILSLREKLKVDEEMLFYTAKSATEFKNSGEVQTLTAKLRRHGIGIMDTDLEGIILDRSLLNPSGKYDLSSVFKTSDKLVHDVSIDSLVKVDDMKEFLASVFDR